ncbi:MAG: hypothetical protein H6717_34010 [Polyangiaceae bacterium]|nr:hypothetical protein [Polyangiaceae bacterium]
MSFPRDLADSIVERFKALPPSGYALLANVSSVQDDRFEVSTDLIVRKASQVEAEEIRQAIAFYYPACQRNPFETEVTGREQSEPGVETITVSTLPPDRWRYVVVDHTGGNIRTHALVEASFFTFSPLELGFHAGNGAGATGLGTNRGLDRALDDPEPDQRFLALDDDHLSELRGLFEKWINFNHDDLDLRSPVRQFGEILELERHSALRYVGLFTIIESLLTHDPKPSDPADSLTRQVIRKMHLLGRRSPRPPPYVDYFGQARPDTVWTKFYGVRSSIAHGRKPDFAKDFSLLLDLEHATRFLRRATSVVLRQALHEPQLVADLREC